jgi:hypothetical protein
VEPVRPIPRRRPPIRGRSVESTNPKLTHRLDIQDN